MIEAKSKKPLVVEAKTRAHALISGLSEKLGGHDEGFDPHEILEASLAACTILTAELYAARKGWVLEGIEADVKVEKEGAQSELSRRVTFKGQLTDEQIERLTEIIGKCPIHKLLESEVRIATTVVR